MAGIELDSTGDARSFLEKLEQRWAGAGPRLGREGPQAGILEVVETVTV